jgi:hypothetical protein
MAVTKDLPSLKKYQIYTNSTIGHSRQRRPPHTTLRPLVQPDRHLDALSQNPLPERRPPLNHPLRSPLGPREAQHASPPPHHRAPRVNRARLHHWLRVVRVQEARHRARHADARGPAGVAEAREADLDAFD